MRSIQRQWRNGPGGKWTARIRWYDCAGIDIRLQVEDGTRKHNIYPQSKEEAEWIWNEFKQLASNYESVAVEESVNQLLRNLKERQNAISK